MGNPETVPDGDVSLDEARRLLWPSKQKYGKRISWAAPGRSLCMRRRAEDVHRGLRGGVNKVMNLDRFDAA